jgi:hypothetical protein
MAGYVACRGDRTGAYKVLVGGLEIKRPLWRCRRTWKNNIKTELQEVGWGGINWIDLAQDRDKWRSSCECGNEPSGSIKRGECFD